MSNQILDLVLPFLLPWNLVACIRLNKHYYNIISIMLKKELEDAKKLIKPPYEKFYQIFSLYEYDKSKIKNQDIIISIIFQLHGINSSLKSKIISVINQTSHLRIRYPNFNGHAESGNTASKFVRFLPYAYKYIPIEIIEHIAIAYIDFGSKNALDQLEKLKECGLSFQKPLQLYSTNYITPLVLSGLIYLFFNSIYIKTFLIGSILLLYLPSKAKTLESYQLSVENIRKNPQ